MTVKVSFINGRTGSAHERAAHPIVTIISLETLAGQFESAMEISGDFMALALRDTDDKIAPGRIYVLNWKTGNIIWVRPYRSH